MIRLAEPKDLEEMVATAREFVKQSEMPLTFNEKNARYCLWGLLHSPSAEILLDMEGEVLAGAVVLVYDEEFYDEVCAHISYFFVHKEFRGTRTAFNLFKSVMDRCKKRNIKLISATYHPSMGNNSKNSYVKLLGKFGFKPYGEVLMRTA